MQDRPFDSNKGRFSANSQPPDRPRSSETSTSGRSDSFRPRDFLRPDSAYGANVPGNLAAHRSRATLSGYRPLEASSLPKAVTPDPAQHELPQRLGGSRPVGPRPRPATPNASLYSAGHSSE